MYTPKEIAEKIAERREQIEKLEWEIKELMWQPVFDSEGNLTVYADWEE
jgi:hypothetical protein